MRPSTPRYSKWLFPTGLHPELLCAFLFLIRTTRPVSHIPLESNPTSVRSILILCAHLRLGIPSGSFLQVYTLNCCALFCSSYVPRAPSVTFLLIRSFRYLMIRTNYETLNYRIFSSHLLLPPS